MIEMAKQRKIIGEFEQYVHAHKGDAGYTNYDDEVLEGVLALLKAQEPRVMALEEVHALNNGDVVWLEFRGDLCVCAGIFHKVDMLITDMSFETMGGTIFPDIHNGYNVRWRCWNCKPTDEQRKEVEWNG